MSFQIKDFASIAASMINYMRATQTQITDFNIGSVARTLVEAPAIEMDELYQQMFIGLREAIPVSVYNSFGFGALPAEASGGLVIFSSIIPAATDVPIPAGTSVRDLTGKYTYSSLVVATLPAGQTRVGVMMYCTSVGSVTNALAMTLIELTSPITGINSVSNPAAFTSGKDAETDLSRKLRFQGYISSIARGTSTAVAYGAKQAVLMDVNGQVIEEVKFVKIIEPYMTDTTQPVGLALCYIHGSIGVASSQMVIEAQKLIDGYRLSDGTPVPGWKAAGVVVAVIAASEILVNVAATVTVSPYVDPASTRATAASAVSEYLLNLDIGASVSQSEIIASMMSINGVMRVSISSPVGDIVAAETQKIMPGSITLI